MGTLANAISPKETYDLNQAFLRDHGVFHDPLRRPKQCLGETALAGGPDVKFNRFDSD